MYGKYHCYFPLIIKFIKIVPGVPSGLSTLRRPPKVNEGCRLKLHFSAAYEFGAGVSLLTFCSGRVPKE